MIEYTVTLSTLIEKGDFNGGGDRIQTTVFFLTKMELTKQWRAFSRYPVNASENGDLNGGRKSFLMECFLNLLELRRKLKGHGRT